MSDVDLNLLVVLEAALEERNLTRAGDRVGLTPPAMVHALGRLRQVFNDELLVRQGRGFVLSPLSVELLPAVRIAIEAANHTMSVGNEFDPATSRRIFAVSISDYALTVLSEPLQRVIAEQAPGVSVEFDSIPAAKQVQLLRRDLVIAGSRTRIPGQRMTIFTDQFVCIVARDNPQVGNDLSFQEMSLLPYAAWTLGDGTVTSADQALAREQTPLRPVITTTGLLALPHLVGGSELFAFVPERLALMHLDSLGLRIVDTPLRLEPLVEAAHWHPARDEEAGLRWLLSVLQRLSRDLRVSGPAERIQPAR